MIRGELAISKAHEEEVKAALDSANVPYNEVVLLSSSMDIVKLSIDMPWDVIGTCVASFISGMYAQKRHRTIEMHFQDGSPFCAKGHSAKDIERVIKARGSYYLSIQDK